MRTFCGPTRRSRNEDWDDRRDRRDCQHASSGAYPAIFKLRAGGSQLPSAFATFARSLRQSLTQSPSLPSPTPRPSLLAYCRRRHAKPQQQKKSHHLISPSHRREILPSTLADTAAAPHEPRPSGMKAGTTSYPEPQPTTEDGYYVRAPSFDSAPEQPDVRDHDHHADLLRSRLKALTHEQLVDRLVAAEQRLQQWEAASSELVSTLALSPDMTEGYYARTLRELLSAALLTLDSVDSLRHLECSMPCVASESPTVNLRQWRSLAYSEWEMQWAPNSWWVSVSAEGSRWGLGFNVLTRVSSIYLNGIVRVAFSKDLTSMRISFAEKPYLQMHIESSVGWGVVPIPVRQQIEGMVRDEIERFVESRLTGDESMLVVLRRKAVGTLSENDILEATDQAKRASNINLRSAFLL